MRVKLNNNVRPEFRRLIKHFRTFVALAKWLSPDETNAKDLKKLEINLAQMKKRGHLSVKYARIAEEKSNGKYIARKLAMRGEIQ